MRAWWTARSTRTQAILIIVGVLVLGAIANGSNKPSSSTEATAARSALAATAAPAVAASAAATSSTAPPPAPATAAPTVARTATPPPAPTPFHFGSGQKIIGTDVAAGTYRTRHGSVGCYWARLRGFGGSVGDIIANTNTDGPTIMTIAGTDKGFESTRCAEWSADLSAITKSQTDPFPDGTYIVGSDISAGTWRNSGGSGCYWQRMKGFGGTVADLIANANVDAPVNVAISASDKGFSTTRCGTWTKVG